MTNQRVFLGPDVLEAFIDRGHPQYDEAVSWLTYFATHEFAVFTDIASITTVYTSLLSDISESLAQEFLQTIMQSSLNILYPDDSDLRSTIKVLRMRESEDVSFSQALQAVLANRKAVHQIATFSYFPSLFGLTVFALPEEGK